MSNSGNSYEENKKSQYAIILAGGSGTRLWPLSRTLMPKQLIALNGEMTLLQQTVLRALEAFDQNNIWIVTNEEHVFEVRSQVKELAPGLSAQVLAEPVGRNTLPAIVLGLDRIVAADSAATVAVFPSDHRIDGNEAWKESLGRGLGLAADGWFVTFGVNPTKPETGYGYIQRGREIAKDSFEVGGFREKPDLETARKYVESGNYYWNSGMFMFSAEVFMKAVERFVPEIWEWWSKRGTIPLVDGYAGIPDISVDYGIAEHISHQAVVKAEFEWDDLGNWEALHRLGDKDAQGNVVQGDVLALGCENSLLVSRGGKLAAVGLKGQIVVQTRDATLVCPIEEVQRVKDVVNALKQESPLLVEAHVTVKRPWGSYTVLEEGPGFKVKRIMVLPGARLSKQMHYHRSEHWVVISGTAVAEVDGVEHFLTENKSVDIPKGGTHRLSNPGKVPTEIIEVQSGPYLEEDDIVRFDDVYGRKSPQ